nr:hypothetical protein Iba_chr13cCG17090 [Ipomoea batatas]GME06002.1 hypothetical protein Iba_scaffold3831CG0430 [Ipomoea batatas]
MQHVDDTPIFADALSHILENSGRRADSWSWLPTVWRPEGSQLVLGGVGSGGAAGCCCDLRLRDAEMRLLGGGRWRSLAELLPAGVLVDAGRWWIGEAMN